MNRWWVFIGGMLAVLIHGSMMISMGCGGSNSGDSAVLQSPGGISEPELFRVSAVYFSETQNPMEVLLNIKIHSAGKAVWRYEIYFPPQAGTDQGIGPIEVEAGSPPTEFRPKVEVPEEVLIQEFIARSYPDNVPEFGKSYFGKINFYLTDGTVREWGGRVGWSEQAALLTPSPVPSKEDIPTAPMAGGAGEIVVGFPAVPALSSWEQELVNEWVPSFVCSIIWGYRVYLNGNFWGDYPAVYTPVSNIGYTLTDPQSLTISGLTAGSYYQVDIYPLGIYFSPNLVTPDGRRYAYKKTGPSVFVWAWIDAKGNPTSPWSPLPSLREDQSINNPGYFFIYKGVFSGRVEAKRSGGGGGGGGGGLYQ